MNLSLLYHADKPASDENWKLMAGLSLFWLNSIPEFPVISGLRLGHSPRGRTEDTSKITWCLFYLY